MIRNDLLQEFIYPAISIAGVLILYQLVFTLFRRWSRRKKRFLPVLLTKYLYYPGLLLIINVALFISLTFVSGFLSDSVHAFILHVLKITGICFSGFVVIRLIVIFREITLHQYAHADKLDYSVRKAKTKFQLIERIIHFLIIFAIIAFVLMTFENVRKIGTTLLASAGVVGIIIGFAAQKSLGTMFAGIQIALSQPIRIGDTVVVEGQFGTIGEITLTFVVVNIWDGRRLIMPISYFLEKSFENWTMVTPEVVGKASIHVDYSLPVEEVREQCLQWITSSPLWDGRTKGFVVTGANNRTMEVRATMSAKNSDDAYTMECMIREKLITYIREKHPYALPKARIYSETGRES
jgi:small-conductance mechanosensitive channel